MVGRENGESNLIPEDLRAFNRARSVSSTEEGPSPIAGHFSGTFVLELTRLSDKLRVRASYVKYLSRDRSSLLFATRV